MITLILIPDIWETLTARIIKIKCLVFLDDVPIKLRNEQFGHFELVFFFRKRRCARKLGQPEEMESPSKSQSITSPKFGNYVLV
jgi:hypothetical protein